VHSSEPHTLDSPRSDSPPPVGTVELGGSEASELQDQVKQGNLTGLREYLARTRIQCDWQDRIFMLGLIVPSIPLAALDLACEAEPEAADLFLIRCAFLSELAPTMRGSGTADQAASERFRSAAECIKSALNDLDRAAQLDSLDPTAHAYVLPSLTIFGHLASRQRRAFQQATELAPDLVPAYRAIVNALSERWHGSHEQSLKFARNAMAKASPGSDMAACLFGPICWCAAIFPLSTRKPKLPRATRTTPRLPENSMRHSMNGLVRRIRLTGRVFHTSTTRPAGIIWPEMAGACNGLYRLQTMCSARSHGH